MRISDIVREFRNTVEWAERVNREHERDLCEPEDRAEDMDRVIWSRKALDDLYDLADAFRDAYHKDGYDGHDWQYLAHSFILGVQGHGAGLWDMGIDDKIPALIRAEKDNRASFYCWAGPRGRIARMERG